jgi:hypothetical protein
MPEKKSENPTRDSVEEYYAHREAAFHTVEGNLDDPVS